MKPNLPLLVGGAIVATGLAILLLWQPEPSPEELARPALEHHRSVMQGLQKLPGQDYRVDPPVLLSRDEEEVVLRLDVRLPGGGGAREYYRLKRAGRGWAFDRDLSQSFTDFVKEQERAILDRLGARLAERLNSSIRIPAENIRISFHLRDDVPAGPRPPDAPPARLIGRVTVNFNDRGAVSMYVEEFAFEKGEWRLQGAGNLFDRGPGAK
jgi:hypothetical protein